MIPLPAFLAAIQQNARRITHYESCGDGSGGGCDCIGLIIGAVRLAGGTWPGTHGSNYAARHVTDELHPVSNASGLMLGEIVFKAREPGQPGYDLPAAYDSSPDRLDYYHVGVVTAVNPLTITHCTNVEGGIQRDTKLGAWAWGGRLKYVDYDGEGSEESMEFPYLAEVWAPNKYPVKLREEPNQDANILEKVDQGTVVDVLAEIGTEEDGKWCFIRHGDRTGYMMKEFLKPLPYETSDPPQDVYDELTIAEMELEKAQEAILEALEAVRAAKGETEA